MEAIFTLVALAAGFIVSCGLGQELLLYVLVAGGITLAVGTGWRATHT